MKIILDTNVLLSNYLFQGYTADVFEHIWLNHEIFLSDWILNEFKEKCQNKFKISTILINEILKHLKQGSKIVNPTGTIPIECQDPDDNNVLHLAKFINANFIITGDKDLLNMKPFNTTEIISPRDYKIRYLI
ncbi:putative toxin-antitoxin system toxin component, PIN family [Leptospira sp. 96542]|nr:putative toxin-antitoxin system toxin component, PIN family [Leptospira sp. 96542]